MNIHILIWAIVYTYICTNTITLFFFYFYHRHMFTFLLLLISLYENMINIISFFHLLSLYLCLIFSKKNYQQWFANEIVDNFGNNNANNNNKKKNNYSYLSVKMRHNIANEAKLPSLLLPWYTIAPHSSMRWFTSRSHVNLQIQHRDRIMNTHGANLIQHESMASP